MSPSVTAIRLERASAWRELAVVGGCLARATPALIVSDLAGTAVAAGRHQLRNAADGARRWSGGRRTRHGDGIVSVCAVLPRAEAWLDEAGPLSGPRLLNRHVRGVLAGLSTLAKSATYPGRDFVNVDGRRVAYVSLAREPNGAFLFQAIVAATRVFTTSDPEPDFPGLPAPPAAGVIDVEPSRVAQAMFDGFASRFGLTWRDAEPAAASPPRLVLPPFLRAGDPIATPIGALRAHVSLAGDGSLAEVRFTGDWIASVADVATLENALQGLRPDEPHVEQLCMRWLAAPAHLVVGVPDAEPLVAALRSAASRCVP